MTPGLLLDADMQTIGQWLLGGLRWWIDEIRALVPARSRRPPAGGLPRFAVERGALVSLAFGTRRAVPIPKARTWVTIVIPAGDCLIRVITRPALNERDLQRMITFEADTLLPIPAGSALIAARNLGAADEAGKIRIEVAGLPVDKARELADVAAATGLVPVSIVLSEAHRQAPPLDFAPAMRGAGLLAHRRSATPLLWAFVAILMTLNVAIWIWRDAARVAGFERLVAEQQPAMNVAQTVARRGEQDRRLIARSLGLRRSRDPLNVFAAVSGALPPGVWLQRLAWDGESVRLVGYRPEKADVATALRRSGRFAAVRAAEGEIQTVMPTGEPFDITARVTR
ncbi:hypothetical protein E5A73_20605 [Sphingomonas gei]|uniref:General secretion pathway protein GspL n=1 Tax=Sphingomonas gei TaxID=1395960 RepID=A0A4S1WYQ5_9SPHN|nr:PilN domain-containing protein [Sphingomonas gei]TGX48709.1 hypothetical protein E5A73_20605 [Sphingomonas gei]